MKKIAENAVIDPTVVLPQNIEIAPFCVIEGGTVLGDGTVLGAGCILEQGTVLGEGAVLGHYVTVGQGAQIGARTRIGDHTVIYSGARLGAESFVGSHASLGRYPKPAAASTVKVQNDLPPLTMGRGCTIGCSTVLYAGTSYGDQVFLGDSAMVRERCVIGEKVVIGSGTVVENDTTIGAFTKIQTGSYITAYMTIEEQVFIAPMVTTTNDNFMGRTEKRFKLVKGPTIRRGARIGGGSILLPGVQIASETFVAAGALVTKDTESKRVVKGFPAKGIKDVPEEELL